MKIILLKDTKKVGKKYEIKDVADGFAVNSLIPGGFAIIANAGNIKLMEGKKGSDLANNAKTEAEISKALNDIGGMAIEIKGKMNDKGSLFAGIHKEQISAEVKKQNGANIQPEYIILDKPIKEVGEHAIKVKVGNKEAQFKLVVKAEK